MGAYACRATGLLVCMGLSGCFQLGPDRLDADQVGFARAVGDAQKRQTLLNVVRLRYADVPSFLDATQVISGYQLQRNLTGGFEAFPSRSGSSAPRDAFASVEYQRTWFWIADDDFDSKLAFTVVQILLALATTSTGPGTIITIPSG